MTIKLQRPKPTEPQFSKSKNEDFKRKELKLFEDTDVKVHGVPRNKKIKPEEKKCGNIPRGITFGSLPQQSVNKDDSLKQKILFGDSPIKVSEEKSHNLSKGSVIKKLSPQSNANKNEVLKREMIELFGESPIKIPDVPINENMKLKCKKSGSISKGSASGMILSQSNVNKNEVLKQKMIELFGESPIKISDVPINKNMVKKGSIFGTLSPKSNANKNWRNKSSTLDEKECSGHFRQDSKKVENLKIRPTVLFPQPSMQSKTSKKEEFPTKLEIGQSSTSTRRLQSGK